MPSLVLTYLHKCRELAELIGKEHQVYFWRFYKRLRELRRKAGLISSGSDPRSGFRGMPRSGAFQGSTPNPFFQPEIRSADASLGLEQLHFLALFILNDV